jgi:hypothetical protein
MTTPADFRAARARLRFPIYQLAAEVPIHPSRLGMMLNERLPMPPDVAKRLADVLEKEASGR